MKRRLFNKRFLIPLASLLVVLSIVLPLVIGSSRTAFAAYSLEPETSASDGYIYATSITFATVRDAASGTVDDSSGTIKVENSLDILNYNISRAFLYFDTSALPDPGTYTITGANLELYFDSKTDADSESLTVTNGMTTYPHDPLAGGDYDKANYSGNGGGGALSVYGSSGLQLIALNTTGKSWINDSGITKFCLKLSNSEPSGINAITFDSQDGTNAPVLSIDYVIDSTVTTSAATAITSTGATLHGEITDVGGDDIRYQIFGYGATDGGTNYLAYDYAWVSDSGHYSTGTFQTTLPVVSEITPGTFYHFRAFALGWAGRTGYGSDLTFLTLPEAPTGFDAAITTADQIDLSWAKGTGADTTVIRAKLNSYPTSVADGTEVYNDTGTSYNDTGLTHGDRWYYRAWSYCTDGGLTQYSSTYGQDNDIVLDIPTVTTNAATSITSLGATLNGNITDKGGNSIRYQIFAYGLTDGGTNYMAYDYAWVSGSDDWPTGAFNTVLPQVDEIVPGTLYHFRAFAYAWNGWTGYGSDLTFTSLPEDPADLVVTSQDDGSISLSWTPGAHATKSNLVWDTSDYPAAPNKNSPYYFDTGASTTVTGLDPGQIYYFRVWSWVSGSDVWSENYDEVTDYTLPSAVTDFRITSPTNSSTVDLEWTKGTGGDTTMVRYLADSAPTDPTGVADGSVEAYADTGSSCSVAGLPGGHIYYFAAWAYDTDSTYYSTIVTASTTPSASFTRYYSLSSDGTLYLTDADYADAQAPADGLGYVDSASTTIRVGQDYTTFYSVWRGVLMFTVDIPSNAVITAAQLGFYASSKTIDTNQFDFTIVSGSILNNPLVAGDYGALWYSNTSFGSMSTSLIGTSSYTYINLNANGIAAISRDGTTIFGLRSSLDIAGTPDPTDSEYIDIYSAESGYSHSPMLLVTYTIPPLGAPSNFGISYPQVFTGFTADGDQLYVFRTTVVYPFTPDQASYSAYNIQLLSADGTTVIAQTPLMMWGYRPASIYLNPDDALPWAGAYIIKIVQIADDSINTSVVLSTDNWIRSSGHMEKLDTWVEYTTIWMELKDGVDNGTYHTAASNQWLLSEEAAAWYVAGVPGLDYVRTNLFLIPSALVPGGPDTTGTYASGLFSGHWGDYWSGIFDSLGDSVGIGGAWLASLVFLLIAIIAVYFVRRETNESPVAFAAALPVLGMGVLFGVPLYLVLIFGVVALFLMLRDMILARS
jgi:hypothetical protein